MLTAKELLTKGIDTQEIFSKELIERGKLNSTTAYELRVGKGLTYRDGSQPLSYKVNIVYLDEHNNEVRRDVGHTTLYEEKARRFIAQQRDKYIRLHNKALAKAQKLALKTQG